MRILIVGGGLGGMALAAFLQQRSLNFQLWERAADFSDQGFALGLWSNGRAILQRLGLANEFDTWGTPINRYQIHGHAFGHRERLLRTFPLDRFQQRFGAGYVQIGRQRLHRMLTTHVDPGRIRMKARLTSFQRDGNAILARSTHEPPSDSSTAETHNRFDLIVGADGVHSIVRAAAMSANLERFTGWRSWYGWIDKSLVPPGSMVEYLSPGRCAALFDDAHGNHGLGVFFAAQPPGKPPETPAAVRDLFQSAGAGMQAALESAGPSVRLGADLATVRLPHWTAWGNITLLGDAAHAFEPHNGLGASMAMEDAAELAEQLHRAANGQQTVSAALASYQQRRRPRVALAQRISDRIRRLAFIQHPLWRTLGDAAIPLLPIRWFERDLIRLFDAPRPSEPHFDTSPAPATVPHDS